MGTQVLMAGLGGAVVLLVLVVTSPGSAEEAVSGGQDGEDAMKNLEAAQVQMEQKLQNMTSFIDKELEKETFNQLGVSRRKRETSKSIDKNPNPYKLIKPNEVKKVLDQMTKLEKAFESFVSAFEKHANNEQIGDKSEPLLTEPIQPVQDSPKAHEERTEEGTLDEDVGTEANEGEAHTRIEATPPVDQPNAEEGNAENLEGEPDEEDGKYFNQGNNKDQLDNMENEEEIDNGDGFNGEEQENENDEESKKYEEEQQNGKENGNEMNGENEMDKGRENAEGNKPFLEDETGKLKIGDEEQTTQNAKEGNTENPEGELDEEERKFDNHGDDKDQFINDKNEEEGGDKDQENYEEDLNNEGEGSGMKEENEGYEGRKYNEQVIYKADGGEEKGKGKLREEEDIEIKREQNDEEESRERKGKERRRPKGKKVGRNRKRNHEQNVENDEPMKKHRRRHRRRRRRHRRMRRN